MVDGDADGKRLHERAVAVAGDREMLAVDTAFERAIHGLQEIVAVRLDVEADQIRAEQAIQQLALPGADAEGFRIGPGDVPEDGHARIRTALLDHLREQREMVVLHEHDRAFFVRDFLEHGIGEMFVDGTIGFPVAGAEDGACVGDVAQGPQAFVGEAEVKPLLFFLGEPNAAQRVLVMFRRHANASGLVDGFAVGIAGGLGDPGSFAGAQDRFERGHQAAGRDAALDGVVAVDVFVGLAVGDGEQMVAAQAPADEHTQAVGGPVGFGGFAQVGFVFGGGSGCSQAGCQLRRFLCEGRELALLWHFGNAGAGAGAQLTQPLGGALQAGGLSPCEWLAE